MDKLPRECMLVVSKNESTVVMRRADGWIEPFDANGAVVKACVVSKEYMVEFAAGTIFRVREL